MLERPFSTPAQKWKPCRRLRCLSHLESPRLLNHPPSWTSYGDEVPRGHRNISENNQDIKHVLRGWLQTLCFGLVKVRRNSKVSNINPHLYSLRKDQEHQKEPLHPRHLLIVPLLLSCNPATFQSVFANSQEEDVCVGRVLSIVKVCEDGRKCMQSGEEEAAKTT